MKHWHVLLIAGIAALPSGCVTLPETTDFTLKGSPAAGQTSAAAAPELAAPQAVMACLATGEMLEKQGYEKEALLEYQRARHFDAHQPGVARRLAVLYGKQGETERARTEFETALREQPRDADLFNDFGYFQYQLGESAAAEKSLRQALALDPKHQRAWVNLGKVLVKERRYEESCEAFCHVVRPAQAAANVGILLAKEGKVPEARQVLHKALGLEPDLQAARVVLSQLETETPPEVRLTIE
jgi:Tfp pilus assembly protein PilF